MPGRAHGLRKPAPNRCSRQRSEGTLPRGVAIVHAAVVCALILSVTASATIVGAAAQPSPGAASSSSVESPRSTRLAAKAKRTFDSHSASLPSFDDFPHRLVPAAGVFSDWCGDQGRYLIWNSSDRFSRLFAPTSDDPLM